MKVYASILALVTVVAAIPGPQYSNPSCVPLFGSCETGGSGPPCCDGYCAATKCRPFSTFSSSAPATSTSTSIPTYAPTSTLPTSLPPAPTCLPDYSDCRDTTNPIFCCSGLCAATKCRPTPPPPPPTCVDQYGACFLPNGTSLSCCTGFYCVADRCRNLTELGGHGQNTSSSVPTSTGPTTVVGPTTTSGGETPVQSPPISPGEGARYAISGGLVFVGALAAALAL